MFTACILYRFSTSGVISNENESRITIEPARLSIGGWVFEDTVVRRGRLSETAALLHCARLI
jgi:hypothetical protein